MPAEELQPVVEPATRRDALESAFDEVEQAAPAELAQTPARARDEVGRFAPKTEPQPQAAEVPQQPQWAGPSTWKKEYRPLYDKLAAGQPLTPDEAKKLADYTNQRENDFKTGVSTYRTEATRSKEIQDAIAPFMSELQANNLHPAQWIKQMGQAHYALAKGPPELKLQVFRQLAQQYGVPLGAVLQSPQQVPTIVNDLLGQIAELRQQVSGVSNWRQQQESTSLTSEIAKFETDVQNYPHFQALKPLMAQLLEYGMAHDLNSAYDKAKWMNEDTRGSLVAPPKPNPLPQARARALSPRSATPSGQAVTTGAKDRRSLLAENMDQLEGGRV